MSYVGIRMLITTSRRPGHRTRVFCRELVRVLPKARYVPRGVKTVEHLASLAEELGHTKVMVVNSIAGEPKELRFLDVTKGWRWLDARVELGEVKLQRDLGHRVRLREVKICAEGERARKLAAWFGGLLCAPLSDKLPKAGAVALIASDGGLRLQFQMMPGPEVVGPVIQITGFGGLHGEG